MLRDGWPAIALFLVVGVLLSFMLTSRQPTRYQSTGRLVISGDVFLGTANADALPNLANTVATIIDSVDVLTEVQRRYVDAAPDAATRRDRQDVATLDWLRSSLHAQLVPSTSVLDLLAVTPRQRDSHDLAAAGIDGLVAVVRSQVQASTPKLPDGTAATSAKLNIFTRSEDTGKVSPTPKSNAMLGIGVGLVLGIAGGLGLGLVRRRLGKPSEIAHALGAPLFGVVRHRSRLGAHEPGVAEARARLEETTAHENGSVVLLTGPVTAERLAALGTALVESLDGARTTAVLVDADLTGRAASHLLGVTEEAGLGESLNGHGAEASPAFVRAAMLARAPRVPILPAGAIPDAEPTSVLSSSALRQALAVLRDQYRYVIVTGPGTERRAEVISLLGAVDSAIVVIERRGSGHQVDATLDLGSPLASRTIGTLVLD